jgi:hypothetical protein
LGCRRRHFTSLDAVDCVCFGNAEQRKKLLAPSARTVSHLCLNSDYCLYAHFCIVSHMKSLASLAAKPSASAGSRLADMTIATRAHAPRSYAIHGHGGPRCFCGSPHCESETSHRATGTARTEAIAWGAETVLVEIKPRWRPSEDEIVLAAITVILLSLMAIIAVGAAAILTMG